MAVEKKECTHKMNLICKRRRIAAKEINNSPAVVNNKLTAGVDKEICLRLFETVCFGYYLRIFNSMCKQIEILILVPCTTKINTCDLLRVLFLILLKYWSSSTLSLLVPTSQLVSTSFVNVASEF
ncbi:hypothetical protein WN51_05490 [Melipona quadrifasciata]|uniref:Uncharacterized protein n=1 Tax=Melipona quadrifasciata TaxID=166423 RepID=A0A0M9AAL9_9HYME|nr:hypothetical protein WN51_05490 [Melipona quadrifasciata]